jgi:hypothetical protein
MRRFLFGLGAAVLTLAVAGSARAADYYHGHRGHAHGSSYRTPSYFGGYGYPGGYSGYGYRSYWGYGYHPWRGHFDYVPGHVHRHGHHFHYVPPHVDYHHRGHRHEVIPGPFPGAWSMSPWRHYRD